MLRFQLAAGFTLVEAAVVLTVLGFGLSVALPAYRDYKLREEVELLLNAAASAKLLVEEFASANDSLPETAAISLPFPTLARVRSTTWLGSSKAGTVTIAIANNSKNGSSELDAKAIVLRATYDGALKKVKWTCGGTLATTVNPRYLPAGCK